MKPPNNEHFVNIWAQLRRGKLGKAYLRVNQLTSRSFTRQSPLLEENVLPALLRGTYTPEVLWKRLGVCVVAAAVK